VTDLQLERADPTFLGVAQVSPHELQPGDRAILGIPHGVPYPAAGLTAGCADGPAAIRRRSLRMARFVGHWDFDIGGPMLPPDGPHVVDCGDVPGAPDDGGGNSQRAEAAVRDILERGAVPIVLGGDDSVPIPVLRAYADHEPITVLQVDAHLDFRDEVAGVRDGYSSPMRRASEMRHVERIVQVGLRGVGSAREADVADARAVGNVLVTARELRAAGVERVLTRLAPDGPIFVSFDADALDPSVCPAVSAPAPGGLAYDEAVDLLRGIGPRLAGAAFTELVPALDLNELSALVVARLVVRLLG
jgi:agmatinase